MLTISEVLKLKQVDHVKNEKDVLSTIRHPFIVNMYAMRYMLIHRLVTVKGSDDSIVFQQLFLCQHDDSWTAAFSLMKFCINMYLDNL